MRSLVLVALVGLSACKIDNPGFYLEADGGEGASAAATGNHDTGPTGSSMDDGGATSSGGSGGADSDSSASTGAGTSSGGESEGGTGPVLVCDGFDLQPLELGVEVAVNGTPTTCPEAVDVTGYIIREDTVWNVSDCGGCDCTMEEDRGRRNLQSEVGWGLAG